jgi:HD-GYP domain-containing protein (c-di-GMP phosphodiesterase class II)
MNYQIPFLARIVTVADAFDAITTNRPYRMGRSFREGLEELERWAGVQFETEAVVAFRHVIEKDFPTAVLTR